LVVGYFILLWFYQTDFSNSKKEEPKAPESEQQSLPSFDLYQTAKGLLAVLVLVGLFFTSIPREISAMGVAGVLLCSRKLHSKKMLELIDWHLLTLFAALFVVNRSLSLHNYPALIIDFLQQLGVNLQNVYMLAGITSLLSNLVSNVPAVMLLLQFLDPLQVKQWYTLAIASTFAGNLFLIGSIANLIVVEQAKVYNVNISFKEHAKTGVITTILSLLALVVWLMIV